MSTFSITYSFIVNTRARSAQVNQNFTDVLGHLAAHHHDPNIYAGAVPLTNSGIAANAQIRDTQLLYPITRSGLINQLSLGQITQPGIISEPAIPFVAQTKVTLLSGETLAARSPVYVSKTDNKVYACDANDNTRYKYDGYTTTATTGADQSVTVQFLGIVDGFTALDEGEKYYVQDTIGTHGTSIGTFEILTGKAVSSTQLLIMKGTRRASGTLSLGTSVSNQAITTGFRPSEINIHALYNDTDSSANNHGDVVLVHVNGATSAISSYADVGSSGGASESALLRSSNGGYITIGVASLTDTGFTITLAETGSFAGSGVLLWSAKGEI